MKVTELTKEEFKKRVMNYEMNPKEWKFEGDKPAIIDFYGTFKRRKGLRLESERYGTGRK